MIPTPVLPTHPAARSALLRRPVVAVLVLALMGPALAACGASSAALSAPGVRVVATNFALAALARGVGGSGVQVTNLAAGAPDDRTLVPSAAQSGELGTAQLVVEVGGGWQPMVEKVAGTGPRVLAVGSQGTARGSQVWLDPVNMEAAARALEAKLVSLDPGRAGDFGNGLRDFNDNLSSVAVDYQSSLSQCEYNTIFAPDSAFGTLTARNDLKLHVVAAGAGPQALNQAAQAAGQQSYHAVFSEPPLASPQISQLAARGKTASGQLDTMDGPPIRAEPASSTYADRLEANLTYLSGALYCQAGNGP